MSVSERTRSLGNLPYFKPSTTRLLTSRGNDVILINKTASSLTLSIRFKIDLFVNILVNPIVACTV